MSMARVNRNACIISMATLLIKLDEFPVGALIRLAIGYAIAPFGEFLAEPDGIGWRVLPLFVAVLVMMRVLPGLLRKVVTFPPEATAVWVQRRQLAKRFDSYQWRKVLWFGIGMAASAAITEGVEPWTVVLTAASVGAGLLGEITWQARARAVSVAKPTQAG